MKKIKPAISIMLVVFFGALSYCSRGKEAIPAARNIEVFSRLYGYVKYFYPGDEAARTDWDGFAVYGVKRVEKARGPGELKQVLEELFSPLAPALQIHETGQKTGFSPAVITPPASDEIKDLKVVTWQHLGVGVGNQAEIFRSVRLNRPDPLVFKSKFGPLLNQVDAAPYRGKAVKLTAAVKVASGIGQLWLRAERINKEVVLLAEMDEKPIQSGSWQNYQVAARVPDDAVILYFGCFLGGQGQLWADDFQLSGGEMTGNQSSYRWTPIPIKNAGFEEDREGTLPGSWTADSELYTFRVTPATAARGTKSVTIISKPPPDAKPLFEKKPVIGDYIAKELGGGLSCVMPLALYADGTRTFPLPGAGKPERLRAAVEKEVKRLQPLSADDLYVRLAGVVITWNIFQHFYPYFAEVKSDWNAALTQAVESAYRDKSPVDFLETLNRMIAHLKDGQAGAYLPGNSSRMYLPPVNWDWIQGKLVITAVYREPRADIRMGDVVVAVEGLDAAEALEIEEQDISGATNGWRRFRALGELLRGPKNSILHLKIKRDQVIYPVALARSAFSPQYYGYMEKQKPGTGKREAGIFYLNTDNTPMPEIERLMPELQKAGAIICDLRGVPKGSHPLLSHLLTEVKTSDGMWLPQVIWPDYERVTYKKMEWRLEPLKPYLTAKMIFLADNRTMDYAESILGFVRHYNLGTIVGQPTAGTNGSVNSFYLLGKYLIRWTGVKAVKPDHTPLHGVGVLPDLPVERTLNGVKQGRDELLDKALEIARQGL
jgi:C-terminal processing protease CtpA/Prc